MGRSNLASRLLTTVEARAAHHGPRLLRLGLGVVFVWLGALKFVPGLSPAESLIVATVSWAVDPTWFIPLLATWECAIGVGLIIGTWRRPVLLLMFLHMGGTFMPLATCPELVWIQFPHAWTLEGQYILKNLVLIGAGVVLLGARRSDTVSSRTPLPATDEVILPATRQ